MHKRTPTHGMSHALALALLATWATLAHASPLSEKPKGFYFEHHDWVVACDNTRTCRAAGYQAGDGVNGVSLLLTRQAGPGQPVQAQLALADYGEDAEKTSSQALASQSSSLRVNGRALGRLPWRSELKKFGLSPAQLKAVLQALPRAEARIEFQHGKTVWTLSDQGAAAVLLKMDEAQGRVGTPGALAKPGSRPESQVLPPLDAPEVKAARLPKQPGGAPLSSIPGLSPKAMAALRLALIGEAGDKREADLLPPEDQAIRFEPLGGGQWLASSLCWRAAYNEGYCMWVLKERPPHQPRLVTEMASDHSGGVISASHKGRGLGDCWGREERTWNGHEFVLTEESSTGMCKLITPGGAWNLPTWVSKVVGR
jgi:hypothetical protein